MYEKITVEQLPNRWYTADEHSFRSFSGQYPEKKPITQTTYVVLSQTPEGWHNRLETTNEQEAIALFEKMPLSTREYRKSHGLDDKIVVIEPEQQASPVVVEEQVAAVVEPEAASHEEETETDVTVEPVTVYYSNGREVDCTRSFTATVKALPSGTVFTYEQIAKALHTAHPNDEECGDLRHLTDMARRWINNTLSNRMSPASMYLCEEQGTSFVRR